jgi:pyruvate dehydrogenase E2 component (dihydrolipoamide acetyltransferase)
MGDFRMPSLGADMESGTILEWRVAPGDAVTKGDVVAVVDTEKSDIDIEVFESGTVGEILVPVGTKVPVGTPIARIVAAGAPPAPAAAVAAAPTLPSPAPSPEPAPSSEPAPTPDQARRVPPRREQRAPVASGARPSRRQSSPYARRLAAERGIEIADVAPGAPDRPIRAADVAARSDVGYGLAPPRREADRSETLGAVGRLMERSKREIPHFYVSEDIDVSAALDWIEASNAARSVGERVLPAALLLRAVVLALHEVPELNAHFVDGAGHTFDAVHLGVAVAQRGGGLIAPVIHDAQTLSLDELMSAMRGIVARARKGALRSSDVTEATITVTSLGDQGAAGVWGVIVPPQVAIVGFGRIAERPWAEHGMLAVRRVVTATLSADHRVSHGHHGARFLRSVAHALENPEVLT